MYVIVTVKFPKLISLPSLLFGSDLPYQDPLSQVFLVGVPLWWWVGGAEWWAKRRETFTQQEMLRQ